MAKKSSYKKGLSAVVTTVLLIALVMAVVAVVWTIVNNTIKGQIESTSSCFGNYNKVTLNGLYTCYDALTDTVQFSVNVEDLDVGAIIVGVASAGATKSYTLLPSPGGTVSGLANYGSTGFGTDTIIAPSENSGLSYVANGFTSAPDKIELAVVINEQQCEVSDVITGIGSCALAG